MFFSTKKYIKKELELLFKRANKKILELDKKIVPTIDKQFLMLSRNVELKDIANNPFFRIPFINKTIFTSESNLLKLDNEIYVDPKARDFLNQNKISIKQNSNPTLFSSIQYLKEELQCQKILIEIGQEMNEHYSNKDPEQNPVDLLVVILMKGILQPSCIGPKFVKMKTLLKNYEMVHQSRSYTDDFSNKWKILVLEKKAIGQTQKMIESNEKTSESWKYPLIK